MSSQAPPPFKICHTYPTIRSGQIARSEARPIFRTGTFCLKKRKTSRSTNFQSRKQNNEKVKVNSKYCPERQCTCNILIMFRHLMMSKLIYPLMHREKFN